MNNQDHTQRDRQARDIFLRAVEIQSPEARSGYIEGACQHDDSLRSRVEALLKSHKQDSFLETSAVNGATTLISETPVSEGPGAVIDRYKLFQKLGEGGFGVVYMAEQKAPVKRRVALKIIKLGMDTKQVVARFEAERQALAMMDHPNIAKVFDAGATDTGRPYFVMELVKGVPITKYCDDNQLTTKERLDLFIAVCQAIQHAHQKGIIHRDIKPSNILITLHDGVPVPKVIDFGIAKATQQELTEKTIFTEYNQFIGTPAYMSPEQAEMSGLDIDTRSDIYSLGVVLYELLVGRPPLDAKELLAGGYDEMRRRIKEEEPVKPSTKLATFEGAEKTTAARHRKVSPAQLSSELRGDLDWIVLKAIEKDRTRRYETANGFALDLKRYLANEPVTAVAPRPAYLLKKYVRRHRAALAVAVAIAGLLIAGTTISTWQAIRATRASAMARGERDKAQKAQEAERQSRQQAEEEKGKAQTAQQLAEKKEAEKGHLLYVANINLARTASEENNVHRIRELLNLTASHSEQGFEWFYWQRQAHLALRTLRGHKNDVRAVAISPDGKRILTGSVDRTGRVWDFATGKELFSFEADTYRVSSVAFSPDSQRIVTAGRDTTKVRDANTGKVLFTLEGDSGGGWGVAFSPDGKRIALAQTGQMAGVWDAFTGEQPLTLQGHTGPVFSVAFSPEGERIVTGSRDTTAIVWDAGTGNQLLTLKGHAGDISSVALSKDGQRIITASGSSADYDRCNDRTAKVWDAKSGQTLLTLSEHYAPVNALTFSPDGHWIVTGSDDKTARVWDGTSGTLQYTLSGHTGRVSSVSYSIDGRWIVTGGGDGLVKVWAAGVGKEPLVFRGHKGEVYALAISPGGQRVATGSADGTIKLWEATSGKELLTLRGQGNPVTAAAFSPDGQRILTGDTNGVAKLWNSTSGEALRTLQAHGNSQVWGVAFSPDGQHIVTGGQDNTAKVWDAETGEESLTLHHPSWVWSAAFTPDGRRIITACGDHIGRIWDASTGEELTRLRGHTSWLISMALSLDGRLIVTGSGDRTAKVWDAATGKELRTFIGHGDQVWAVVFSRDSRRIVTGCADGTAKLWETDTGNEMLTLKGHTGPIRSVQFSPDGRRIFTGSEDGTARVWEAATPEQVAAWEAEERAATQ